MTDNPAQPTESSTNDSAVTDAPSPGSANGDQTFLIRLAAMHHRRDPALAATRGWSQDTTTPDALAKIARITQGENEQDYQVRAALARAWVIWHTGRGDTHRGRSGSGIGTAMRQLGSAGQGYGPASTAALRQMDSLITAETFTELTDTIAATATRLKSVDWPPHWETLLADLREWSDPSARNTVRLRWAQQFHTTRKAPAA